MPFIALIFLESFFIISLISDGFYPVFKKWLGSSWSVGYSKPGEWWYISLAFLVGLFICFSSLVYTFIKSTNRYKKISWTIVSLIVLTIVQFLFIKLVLTIEFPLFFVLSVPLSILFLMLF